MLLLTDFKRPQRVQAKGSWIVTYRATKGIHYVRAKRKLFYLSTWYSIGVDIRVPLAHEIFSGANRGLTGTACTVLGPSISASPGKVGVMVVETVSHCSFGEHEVWVDRAFFAA